MRDTWPEEPDFSAWLAKPDGLALLGEALGMGLDEAETERQVGPFSADVVCRGVDGVVVVENQFGRTDHDHLGKLLTYSAGLESATIVWIAEKFVEQHRAALDWLNAQTVQEVSFFGLEVELCRIGQSNIAPQLRIVSRPNDWTRAGGGSVRGQSAPSQWDELCQEFWGGFFTLLKNEKSGLPIGRLNPPKNSWLVISIGRADFWLEPAITRTRGMRAALGLPEWAFNLLQEDKSAIQGEAGVEWEWKPQEGRNGPRIRLVKQDYDSTNRDQWPEQHRWMKEHLELLDRAFRNRIQNLERPRE